MGLCAALKIATHTTDLSAHLPQGSWWRVQQDQITGKASLQTQRAGHTRGEEGRLWHSPISCSLMELPIQLHSTGAGLGTLMSKAALCWQGCWQPLSTCHYYHADWNRYNGHFTLLFLPFKVAILCKKYCTLLSLKMTATSDAPYKSAQLVCSTKETFTDFFTCASKIQKTSFCTVCRHILFCIWKRSQKKRT